MNLVEQFLLNSLASLAEQVETLNNRTRADEMVKIEVENNRLIDVSKGRAAVGLLAIVLPLTVTMYLHPPEILNTPLFIVFWVGGIGYSIYNAIDTGNMKGNISRVNNEIAQTRASRLQKISN